MRPSVSFFRLLFTKDIKYQEIFSDNGGDFIPLVCEIFGICVLLHCQS